MVVVIVDAIPSRKRPISVEMCEEIVPRRVAVRFSSVAERLPDESTIIVSRAQFEEHLDFLDFCVRTRHTTDPNNVEASSRFETNRSGSRNDPRLQDHEKIPPRGCYFDKSSPSLTRARALCWMQRPTCQARYRKVKITNKETTTTTMRLGERAEREVSSTSLPRRSDRNSDHRNHREFLPAW